MTKIKLSSSGLIAITVLITFFVSCNNSGDIPFPHKELGYSQPVSAPLVLSTPVNLTWDTARKNGLIPVVKTFDINALPVYPYDSSAATAFAQNPNEVSFNFNALPARDISLDKLPTQSLELKTVALGIVPTVKAGVPVLHKGNPLSIYDFGKAQGMTAKFITALYNSRDGALWVGSSEGLFRYDGDQIQTFIQGSSTDAPAIGITEDKEGNMWFLIGDHIGVINIHSGTYGQSNKIGYRLRGLNRMITDENGNIWLYNLNDRSVSIINPTTQTYKNIKVKDWLSDSTGFQPHTSGNDMQILQDDAKNIWITTMAGGVNIIDVTTGKIKHLSKNSGLSNDSITSISKDKNGLIALGNPGGVDVINTKKSIITRYGASQGFSKSYSVWLFQDDNQKLWRGTFNGIEVADLKNKATRKIDMDAGLMGNIVTSILRDNSNHIWVASTSGLNRIDQYGETAHTFGNTQIISLKEDGSNNLWVATSRGLFIVNPGRNKMHLLDKAHGLSDNTVQGFFEDKGNMIVATDGGYNIIDPVNKTLSVVRKNEGLVNDSIYVAYNDRSGNMWLTGPTKGVYLYDAAKKILLNAIAPGGLNEDVVSDVKQDKNGLVWLASRSKGVTIIDVKNVTVKYLNNLPGLNGDGSRMLLEDKYRRMWIGTNKGIYVADIKNNSITNITTSQGLSHNTVLSLLEYKGAILAGTNNKISIIQAPAPGDTNTRWKISMLENSHTLVKETNSWSTDAITHDGKYLWGDVGVSLINEIKPSNDSAQTNITGLYVMGQLQNYITNSNDSIYAGKYKSRWDSVSGPYNLPVNLVLPHDKNYLQFKFAQTNMSRPDSLFYTYTLQGIDKNWSVPRATSFTENYLNLPAGKYVFKVSSKGIDGKWVEPATFKFTISPPWYQSWWAYVIFAIMGLSVLRFYVVYRSRRLKKENRLLEEKVEHRTNLLKESIENLKSTQSQLIQSEKMASLGELTAGIAHEIQNPLNFVNNFSEVNKELIEELKSERLKVKSERDDQLEDELLNDIAQNLEKINHHGKRADAIVKGMLQHSQSSSGRKEPTDINKLADEYFRLAYHGLRAKDKSFNATLKTDYDESIGYVNIIPQDIGRVILNLITNAFYVVDEKKKSGIENYEPTVSISTKRRNDKIEVSVKDNGNGIPQKILDKIFQPFFTTKPTGQGTGLGLSLSYDIVKAHGGELKVETLSAENAAHAGKEGEGSEFIILLPVF